MGQVLSLLPTQATVDAAWTRYQALVRAALDDPRLNADRRHVEETLKAHRAFADVFMEAEARR